MRAVDANGIEGAGLTQQELIELLEEKADEFNRAEFIPHDPICIPHLFHAKQDIEIASFLTCTIAWGQRPTIIKNARDLMQRMDHRPHDFVMNFKKRDKKFSSNPEVCLAPDNTVITADAVWRWRFTTIS